jgi:hypothetical protein
MRRLLVLLATAMLAVSCGHPLIPAAVVSTATAARPVPSEGSAPIGASRPVLGVDLYALSNYPAATVRSDGQRMLAYIRNVLKADAVGIVWNFYAASRQSDAVDATRATLSARNVGILTRIAIQDNLRVEYRPLIFVPGQPNPWEGLITPDDPAGWFASYYRAELPYLRTAQKLGVSEFITATEMHDLNDSPLWPSFFVRVSRIYRGTVSYAAWDRDYFLSPRRLLPVKSLGMDMYMPLKIPASASSARVTASWEAYFRKMPRSVLRRTAIDETGIAARAGAYRHPGDLGAPGHLSQQVQVNWYLAACRTVRRYHLRGVFFWKTDLTDNPAFPAGSLSTFEGKKGAVAISDCRRLLR